MTGLDELVKGSLQSRLSQCSTATPFQLSRSDRAQLLLTCYDKISKLVNSVQPLKEQGRTEFRGFRNPMLEGAIS